MPHEILDDAGQAASEDQTAAVGVAQIVQAVVLREQHVALLDRRPLMADVLRRAIDNESAGEEPVLLPEQRKQLRRDRDIPASGCTLWRLHDQLTGDALALAPDVQHTVLQIDVAPLQSADLAAAQAREEGQREGEILQDERDSCFIVAIRQLTALLGRVLWFIQSIDRRPEDQPRPAGAAHDGADQREDSLRLSGAAAISGEQQAALNVLRRDLLQIQSAEDRREVDLLDPVVLLTCAWLDARFVQGHVLRIPLAIEHCLYLHEVIPHPIMATNYTIVPRAEWPFDKLDALSRYCFGLIYDRWKLSARAETWHKWQDENGIFCVYDQRELAKDLGVTLPTVRRCLEQLEGQQLLKRERVGKHGACRYYTTPYSRQGMGVPDGFVEYVHDSTCV